MKKELNKVILTIGFFIFMLGLLIGTLVSAGILVILQGGVVLYSILAVCFIYAKNSIIKNVGYALTAYAGTLGLYYLMWNMPNVGALIATSGLLIMLIGAFLYFLVEVLKFFGFVKGGVICQTSNGTIELLSQYKEMEKEKIISETEFDALKKKLFENEESKTASIDDLKKWKKLLDQQVITEEEFVALKAKVFQK